MQMGYDFETSWPVADPRRDPLARFAGRTAAAGGLAPVDSALDHAADAAVVDRLRHPDWSALRARFEAIHALRRSLASESIVAPVTGGFGTAGESVLSACREGTVVNPVYWANGKTPCAITGSVAVPPHAATED
ncbi:MAG: hypothetical protein KGL54_13800 [Sphingomonadales bacterium]|nr:hypothetical protein [Sphingomonadales bacterium]